LHLLATSAAISSLSFSPFAERSIFTLTVFFFFYLITYFSMNESVIPALPSWTTITSVTGSVFPFDLPL